MNGQERIDERRRRQAGRRGFTLIELLVVILIILLVSAVVLPTVLPAISHRQVSEAARILQGALAGARDTAINNNAPAGIRLLPDPALTGQPITVNGVPTLDPTKILASNRYIPIQLAPGYSEGYVLPQNFGTLPQFSVTFFPYYFGNVAGNYPSTTNQMLYLVQAYTNGGNPPMLNPPTSWYWNIRIGDKIQINNSGISYTIVGPMTVLNPELFVNVGNPGTIPPLPDAKGYPVEFLFLTNGIDDNKDGYVDNGWDGVDNDGINGVDDLNEWVEIETWQGSLQSTPNPAGGYPYTITRRPVVSPGARETPLPSNVVVDLTTWNPGAFGAGYVKERSRLPVDPTTGYVDILLNPNGTVVPTTEYSSPSSFGMNSAFYHFWLAERGDLFDPVATPGVAYLLPQVQNVDTPAGETRFLKGERRLLTLFTRTGAINTNQVETFDGNNPSLPFLAPQQGIRGDTR